MKIYVCVKHVPDTAATIKVLADSRIDETITFIMNPYDEHAVEAAARIKKDNPACEVVAVTMGKAAAESTLRNALAMGADRGILVLSEETHDNLTVAKALKAAIAEDGSPDLIITGKEAIDTTGYQTMHHLAAGFGFPSAANITSLSIGDQRVTVECERVGGVRDVIDMPMPCVLGAGKRLNQPGYPALRAIMKARKKEIKKIGIADLSMEPAEGRIEILALDPVDEERTATEIKGTPEEMADEIVRILSEKAKVI